jgi:hypothetical protein
VVRTGHDRDATLDPFVSHRATPQPRPGPVACCR